MVTWHVLNGRRRIFAPRRHGVYCFNSESDLMAGFGPGKTASSVAVDSFYILVNIIFSTIKPLRVAPSE
jgi:hypothetical protein